MISQIDEINPSLEKGHIGTIFGIPTPAPAGSPKVPKVNTSCGGNITPLSLSVPKKMVDRGKTGSLIWVNSKILQICL